MVQIRRDLWRSSGPTPLLKPGYLKHVAQDHVQIFSEYLQGGKLHSLLGQRVPVLGHLQSEKLLLSVQT